MAEGRDCSHGPGCTLPWSVHDWSFEDEWVRAGRPKTVAQIFRENGYGCVWDRRAIQALASACDLRDRYRKALEAILACPNPDSVEKCHDKMWTIASEALRG